ncbi:MAG: hypothetical protein M3Q31_10540, partial [Actinomycetota bacterium]|nr:hypothetical protein [Actinomycetota bacterium]
CTHHTEGRTTNDPTVGCCWDADRLDLRRLGVRPRARFLSTEAAQGRIKPARVPRKDEMPEEEIDPEIDPKQRKALIRAALSGGGLVGVEERRHIDPTLYPVLESRGFLGPPDVVSRDELDDLIANGARELWRSVDTEEHAREFIYAERPFVGWVGICCFAAPNHKAAAILMNPGRKILRMTLKPGTRVEDFDALRLQAYPCRSLTQWAVERGIEAVRKGSEIRVLNRMAVRVQTEILDADEIKRKIYVDE